MKLSKKFFDDLHEISRLSFYEKNLWIGKLVPEIIVDNLKKRDITPDDFEDIVCLTVEEAKGILWDLRDLYKQTYGYEWVKNEPWFDEFKKRIEQAEMSKQST